MVAASIIVKAMLEIWLSSKEVVELVEKYIQYKKRCARVELVEKYIQYKKKVCRGRIGREIYSVQKKGVPG